MTNTALTVYGAPWCPDCRRSKQFLGEQRVPYEWIDIDLDESAREYVSSINDGKQIIPTIVFEDGSFLAEPSNAELAAKLGINPRAERQHYDLIVIGGGPAGLTASLYAAREGIDTLVIERSGVGGQAGVTERIDNYPGFPDGIGGGDLADRIRAQVERFGVEVLPAQAVTSVSAQGQYKVVSTESGDDYSATAVLLTPGARYRRLNVPGEDDLIGAGVHFCATCDGPFYEGEQVVVVGGGNSGVEEGLFLTRFADKVTLLERGDQLKASRILREKAEAHPGLEIRLRTQVQEFRGTPKLESVVTVEDDGQVNEIPAAGAFIFIGLDPNTSFIEGSVDLDERSAILTAASMETSVEGVFAAGDARSGSTKQLTAAVGEGATAALMIREYLKDAQGDRGY